MPINALNIKSRITDYVVHFTHLESFLEPHISSANVIFIVDRKVWDLHNERSLKTLSKKKIILLDVDERIKNMRTVEDLYEKLTDNPLKKNLTLVSIGGGITQDLTGFLASTLYRGINWIYIPTTLLAQADSCIGAKTSLNFKEYKNLIGTFYPPTTVYIYPGFLTTLSDYDFFSGLGEIVKLMIIAGGNNLERFYQNVVSLCNRKDPEILLEFLYRSLQIKQIFIEEDEFDKGRRNILNYGHCIGHALESSNDYKIPHGQAVVVGMALANIISKNRGLLNEEEERSIFENGILPVTKVKINEINTDTGSIVSGLKKDKKREGAGLPLIILKNNFEFTKIIDLTPEEITYSISEYKHRMND